MDKQRCCCTVVLYRRYDVRYVRYVYGVRFIALEIRGWLSRVVLKGRRCERIGSKRNAGKRDVSPPFLLLSLAITLLFANRGMKESLHFTEAKQKYTQYHFFIEFLR
jgi:hypothetical protein